MKTVTSENRCSECGGETFASDGRTLRCTACLPQLPRPTNAELADMLDSAASALRHGRISTAKTKVQIVADALGVGALAHAQKIEAQEAAITAAVNAARVSGMGSTDRGVY